MPHRFTDEITIRRLEERLRLATDAAEIGVWDLDLRDGRLTWDSTMHALFEVAADDFNGNFADWERCVHPDDLQPTKYHFQSSIESGEPFNDEFRIVLSDGRTKHIRARAQVFQNPEGQAVRVVGVNYDITEQKLAHFIAGASAHRAERAHERLNLLTEYVPSGLFEYREGPDGAISFPFFNPQVPEMLGVSDAEICADGKSAFKHIHPDDLDDVVEAIRVSKEQLIPFNTRYRVVHPDRGLLWHKASTMPRLEEDGSCIWYGGLYEITADVEQEERLVRMHEATERMRAENEFQALHDGLTGLPNRRYYDQTLAQRMLQAQTEGEGALILVRVDLDHFKYVNDTLGHDAGDSVLKRVGSVLNEALGDHDFAARIGGDEFSILLDQQSDMDRAHQLIACIRDELAKPHFYEDRQCRFGASFGIAQTDALETVRHDIQMHADAALYKAKTGGRNRVEVFTSQMHEKLLEDRRLSTEIQEGLERGEFVPYFQPQVSAKDGSLAGAEVLLRWIHPTRGVLAPQAFMHVADHLRLVPDLDREMMERCQVAMLNWVQQGLILPRLSFNVSAGRLEDPGIVEMGRRLAAGPTKISFELLESILIEDERDFTRLHLDTIQECGVDIEIDDFGSGHASIVSLMQIKPSTLKIDRRLVIPLLQDKRVRDLVRAIIHMSKSLGIRTIAEGVETAQQAKILKTMGCDVFQGYLYGRPMGQDAFGELGRCMLSPKTQSSEPDAVDYQTG